MNHSGLPSPLLVAALKQQPAVIAVFVTRPNETVVDRQALGLAAEAMGITGLTLPTLYRWVTSPEGRAASLHAFGKGHYLGSGQAHKVLEEAGLHGEGQWRAILRYANRAARVAV